MIDQSIKTKKINALAHQFCKGATRRRDLEKLARECGWSIRQGGREPIIAFKPGYESIPIPGHNRSEVIGRGLALKVAKACYEPVVHDELTRDLNHKLTLEKETLENKIRVELIRAEDAEVWRDLFEEDNKRLRDDVEAAFQLAGTTEIRNQCLRSRLTHLQQRFARFIGELRSQLLKVKLLQQENEKLIQEFELVSLHIKERENCEAIAVEKLKQFSSQLDPSNQDKLNQIIQYLQEQIL